jgi:hypothetical protein
MYLRDSVLGVLGGQLDGAAEVGAVTVVRSGRPGRWGRGRAPMGTERAAEGWALPKLVTPQRRVR